jgi:hypothetical protein
MNHITPGHVRAFQAIRSPMFDNITMFSCFINGEPGVAVVMIDPVTDTQVAVMPLFVAITPGMNIQFPAEQRSSSGGGRRPKSKHEAFHDTKQAVTMPMAPAPR